MSAVQSFIAGGHIDEDIIDGVMEFYNDCTYLDKVKGEYSGGVDPCLLYTSPSPRDLSTSRMPSSA